MQGLGAQQQLLQQYQQGAQGQGPNPALAQLNQTTAANTANQAALMAGQRGSGANSGMIARQAAMQGGANQQQAAGQAATLAAQQQLAQQQALGQQSNQMVNQRQAGLTAQNQAAQGQQSNLMGLQSNVNTNNTSQANTAMQGQQAMIGGAMNSFGPLLAAALAEGGPVPHMASGGAMGEGGAMAPSQAGPQGGPMSSIGKALMGSSEDSSKPTTNYGNPGANAIAQGWQSTGNAVNKALTSRPQPTSSTPVQYGAQPVRSAQYATNQYAEGGPTQFEPGAQAAPAAPSSGGSGGGGGLMSMLPMLMAAAEGGKVPAMVSPGERYLPPKEVAKAKSGANPMELGEKIPGKPKVGGAKNDYANDTVPKTLEEGGLVLPRSVTQSKNPHWAAMKFVQAHMAQGGLVSKSRKK